MNSSRTYGRGGGGGSPAVAFISRNLDYDAAAQVFNSGHSVYAAELATGEPDAMRGHRFDEATWMPDTRRMAETNWLELDYAKPSRIESIRIYAMRTLPSDGEIHLASISGTNILRIPMSSASSMPSPVTIPGGSSGVKVTEFSFPLTAESVKTVRLDFGTARARDISIDAVEVSGPSGSAWAEEARASSDNSSAFMSSPGGSDSIESLRAEAPISEWSEDWLAYTPFDIIAISSADFDSAPPAVISALGNYLLAGGDIIVFGKDALPSAWRSAKQISLADGMEYHAGFGRCFVIPLEKLSSLDTTTIQTVRDTAKSSALYWQNLPHDAGSANDAFRVVENLKLPVRGIVVIMLAFVIIIGPANIILLNRWKKRTRMLWTIPAISVVTTLIVFAYSLLREGITPDTRISGLTMLDQPNHIASTVGVTAFYCPLTPSGGLHFDYETEVTPLIQAGYGGSGSRREVDWTQSQHFWHGWVSARVPAHFHLRKSETRRERLQVVMENGQLSVVNGLGAPVKSLWLADSTGKIFQAKNIAAGQKGGLALSKQSADTGKSDTEALFTAIGYTAQPESWNGNAEKYLRPGTYLAVLDGNPFIENALGSSASPKRTKSSAVVYGILDATDAP
ncbi:MAG: hypothetical protein WDN00_08770 [Limisphaerales bacterium]